MRRKEAKDARLSIRLPGKLRARLEEEAHGAGLNVSQAVVNLIERLASGEVRLWPRRLPDLRRDPPTEGELLALAEALAETRQAIKEKSATIYAEAEAISSQVYKLSKVIRKASRASELLDRLEQLFGIDGDDYFYGR